MRTLQDYRAPYKKSTPKAGAQCAPYKTIALVIHSLDPTNVLFEQVLTSILRIQQT